MATFVLIIHLLLALGIIGLVLLQRSEGGGLGIGGGGGGLGSLASAGTTANMLTRTTAILAAAFFCTSLLLAVLAGHSANQASLLDVLDEPAALENLSGSVDTRAENVDNELPEATATGNSDEIENQSENTAPSVPLSE